MEKKVIEGKRLGKLAAVPDKRTLMLAPFLAPPHMAVPHVYDVDAGRRPMPYGLWGNDQFGDCVFVTNANHLVREERLDTRKSIPITTEIVVDEYKLRTGCVSPGDAHDTGYEMIQRLREWRQGWHLPVYKTGFTSTIDAFGGLTADHSILRAAAYLLGGIELGIWLPLTALDQIDAGQQWDAATGPRSEPGSWGGHAVYVKHYDDGGMWCITWGREQYMTNAFIDQYVDERWAVVDKLQSHGKYLDEAKLRQYLADLHPTQSG